MREKKKGANGASSREQRGLFNKEVQIKKYQ